MAFTYGEEKTTEHEKMEKSLRTVWSLKVNIITSCNTEVSKANLVSSQEGRKGKEKPSIDLRHEANFEM